MEKKYLENDDVYDTDTDYTLKDKSRAVHRRNNVTKALRKQAICAHVYGFPYYSNLHEYSKNKIHCSCPRCSAKTNDTKHYKGRKPNFPASQAKKIDSMKAQLKAFWCGIDEESTNIA